jgi:hypothetical protein
MIDQLSVKHRTKAAFQTHRATIGVTGVRDGTFQSIRIPVGAILTCTASVDYASRRVPMMWDGRRVELFVADLTLCATQIEAPCTREFAAPEQPVAREPPMPEIDTSQKAKCA